MENQLEVIRIIFTLLETMDESLDYIEDNENEQSMKFELLEYLELGIKSIEESTEGMQDELMGNEIVETGHKLIESIQFINQKKTIETEDSYILKQNYNIFKVELERCLKPYMMC